MVPSLERVVKYMNLPIDVQHRKKLNRLRRRDTKAVRALLRKTATNILPLDSMSIQLSQLAFGYQASGNGGFKLSRGVGGEHEETIEIRQGELISFVGPRSEGKTTLLKILGGVVLPEVGEDGPGFFIPSHLRVLHISPEAIFFHGTLLDNICFGVRKGDSDGDIDRVKKVCRRLGLPETVMSMFDSEEERVWGEVLSLTQRHLLSLARAFIANPEVLCIHKPTMPFDEVNSREVFKILREYVDEKGLEQDPASKHLRRPRTCLITSSRMGGIQASDKVFHVSRNCIRDVAPDEVTEDMLQ